MLNWDSEIQNDGGINYITLPEGDYEFEVTNLEKGEHRGSAKIPPCPKATLELTFATKQGISVVKENLFLDESAEWKLCQFFRCIGQREHGQRYKMNWDKVVGARGRAHIYVEEWTGDDGAAHKNNRVKTFLDMPDAFEL